MLFNAICHANIMNSDLKTAGYAIPFNSLLRLLRENRTQTQRLSNLDSLNKPIIDIYGGKSHYLLKNHNALS